MPATNEMYRQLLSQAVSGSALIGGAVSGGYYGNALIGGYFPNLARKKGNKPTPAEIKDRMEQGYTYIERKSGENKPVFISPEQYTKFYNMTTSKENQRKAAATREATTLAINSNLEAAIKAAGKTNLPRLEKDIIIAQTKDALRKARAKAKNTPEEKKKRKEYRKKYEERKAAEADLTVEAWRKAKYKKREKTPEEKAIDSAITKDPRYKALRSQLRTEVAPEIRSQYRYMPLSRMSPVLGMPSPVPPSSSSYEKKD